MGRGSEAAVFVVAEQADASSRFGEMGVGVGGINPRGTGGGVSAGYGCPIHLGTSRHEGTRRVGGSKDWD